MQDKYMDKLNQGS